MTYYLTRAYVEPDGTERSVGDELEFEDTPQGVEAREKALREGLVTTRKSDLPQED